MMKTILVKDYMTASPHSIGVTVTLADAKKMMTDLQIRHLPVLDRGTLVGVVSERDVQMVEASTDEDVSRIKVEEAMSPTVYTVRPSTPLEVVAGYLATHKLGSAVVTRGEKVVGVFTVTDGMRALADLLQDSAPSATPKKAAKK